MENMVGVTDEGRLVTMEQIEQQILHQSCLVLSNYFTGTRLDQEYFSVLSKFYSGLTLIEKTREYLSKEYRDEELTRQELRLIMIEWHNMFLKMPGQDLPITLNEIQAKGQDGFFDYISDELRQMIGRYESLLQIKDVKLDIDFKCLIDGEFFVNINWTTVSTNNRNNVVFPFYIS